MIVNGGILLHNWGLNHLLSPSLGALGLALATAFSLTVGGIVLAILLLWKTSGIRLLPVVKCIAVAVVTGLCLRFAAGMVLTGAEGKILLVAKCLGLGVFAVALYLLLMYITRQEDFWDLAGRYFPSHFHSDNQGGNLS